MKAWEKNIRTVEPYVPGEQPDRENMIKLNTNECPYAPAPGVVELTKEFDTDHLRLYPDPDAKALTSVLADYYGVGEDQVFVGVGSDDVLATAFLTFFNSDKPIFFPDITYSFYPVWADLFRIPYETKAVDEQFQIKNEDYYGENGGVVFPNPNAPTGLFKPLSEVEDIIKHNPDVIVIVDEAYVDFGGESAYKLVDKYENLLVVQTFSKSRAMAGMRIGFAIGSKRLIAAMNDVKFSYNSYTMNQYTLKVGVAAVQDNAYFKDIIGKIIKTREAAKVRLKELGFTFPDSKANFIFASHKDKSAKEIFDELRKRDIFVRYFSAPRVNNSLRITIGTDEQMEKLFAALEEILH